MNLEQIKTFIFIAQTRNFRQAGEILYISQPTASARMKSLENKLGFKLLSRNGLDVVLTKEGKAFLPFAIKSVEHIEDGMRAINILNDSVKGELNISVVLSMAYYILPDIIKNFKAKFPDIKLNVYSGHSDNVLDMVLNNEVSLGILRSTHHPLIENIHLMNDELVLVAFPNHPFSALKKISLQDLKTEPLILFNQGFLDRKIFNEVFYNLNTEPNIIMESDNINLIKRMIKNEMGIGILPKSSINKLNSNLNEIEIIDSVQINKPLQLIHLKNSRLKELSDIFIQFIIKEMK